MLAKNILFALNFLLLSFSSFGLDQKIYNRDVFDHQEQLIESSSVEDLKKSKLKRMETLIEKKEILKKVDTVEEVKMTELPDHKLVMYFSSGIAQSSDLLKILQTIKKINSEDKIAKVHVVGHTDDERLSSRSQKIFGTNQGLSSYRAKFTANSLKSSKMVNVPISFEGRGFDDPIVEGSSVKARAKNRRTEIFIYLVKTRLVKEVRHEEKSKVLIEEINCPKRSSLKKKEDFRISIDGESASEKGNSADRQRCMDVALEKAKIQIHLNKYSLRKSLNVKSSSSSVNLGDDVTFSAFSNYTQKVNKAELRFFEGSLSQKEKPLLVIPFELDDYDFQDIKWTLPKKAKEFLSSFNFSKKRTFQYVLRVYDENLNFDETYAQKIDILNTLDIKRAQTEKSLFDESYFSSVKENQNSRESIHGEIAVDGINLNGTSVVINGEGIPSSHKVYIMGQSVKIDQNGKFVTEQILETAKKYDLEVVLADKNEQGMTYSRELYIPSKDWFFVGLADMILGQNRAQGPVELITQDLENYKKEVFLNGRLAFFLKGKIKGKYLIKASVDTRENNLQGIFDQFLDKDPNDLFRRLDPNEYYPVYGDDSSLVEDAPTQGKLYLKIEKGDSHFLWGNFKPKNYQSELARIDRGLYGANLHLESKKQNKKGNKKFSFDAFASQPGTVNSRNEFRGGQSFYVLRNRDIVPGSEQVRVIVKDQFTDQILQTRVLNYAEDYSINYILGSITLRDLLPSFADASDLVRAGAYLGNPVFLSVSYEHVPGFTRVDSLVYGGRASAWLGDHVKLGVSSSINDQPTAKHEIKQAELQVNFKNGSYLKGEVASTKGVGAKELSSIDGGYTYQNIPSGAISGNKESLAYYAEAKANIYKTKSGQAFLDLYYKSKDAGFSSVGELVRFDTTQIGADLVLPLFSRMKILGKYQRKKEVLWEDLEVKSVGVETQISPSLLASVSFAENSKLDLSSGAQVNNNFGKRGEGIVEFKYSWAESSYVSSFFQKTLSRTGNRLENDRYGLGLGLSLSPKMSANAEASDGDLGLAASFGISRKMDEDSEIYSNYLLENNRSDTSSRINLSKSGKLINGVKKRFGDSSQIFYENRFDHGLNQSSGLAHSFGIDHQINKKWNFSFQGEIGRIKSSTSELKRRLVSIGAGYGYKGLKISSSLEMRKDIQVGTSQSRLSWLSKNTIGAEISDSWRFLGRLNLSQSKSAANNFFNGDYLDGILGLAYRPVLNDRFNFLSKYRFYKYLPSAGQVDSNGNRQDFSQRAHVFSFDSLWDINKCQKAYSCGYFSLGFKYAYASRQLQNNRFSTGKWFKSDKHLGIGSLTYHSDYKWDLQLEYRRLALKLSEESLDGLLAGVYYNFGNKKTLKLGGGYNFTNYSTDLTNDDYEYGGWFVNIVGGF